MQVCVKYILHIVQFTSTCLWNSRYTRGLVWCIAMCKQCITQQNCLVWLVQNDCLPKTSAILRKKIWEEGPGSEIIFRVLQSSKTPVFPFAWNFRYDWIVCKTFIICDLLCLLVKMVCQIKKSRVFKLCGGLLPLDLEALRPS